MKFSWIVVFALCALVMGVASHGLGLYMESLVRTSELACLSDQMAEVMARSREATAESEALKVKVGAQSAAIRSLRLELAEEKSTHEPLRKQIAGLSNSSESLDARVKRMVAEVASLEKELAEEKSKASQKASIESSLSELEREFEAFRKQAATELKEAEALADQDAKRLQGEHQQKLEELKKRLTTELQETSAKGNKRVKELEGELVGLRATVAALKKELNSLKSKPKATKPPAPVKVPPAQ